ncbi:serine protease [Blastopirellula sp. J2-11]|uniref:serine protease n=1 Tax=Blastopirellula sp. J2-11 TaxID=2943192 RepID=UPI0021C9A012|nr:serine protease [Blastopirellula sp. J2-11]UUO08168.1 serine protease [Blastopirellula sp. J2-11]
MSLARLSCLTVVVIAMMGCGRSKPTAPTVQITMPEDGGAPGNGFVSGWNDAYAAEARARPSERPPPGMFSPGNHAAAPRPGYTRPPMTNPPVVNRQPPVTMPPRTVPSMPPVSDPNNLTPLSPTLEPIVVQLTMTKQDGRVVHGGGVVVSKDGLVVTTASLIQDAVAGEAVFCNQQKTTVLGHFANHADDENPLAAVIVDTHGFELEATRVSPLLASKNMTVKIGDPLLYFETDAFPFPRQQIVANGLLQPPHRRTFNRSDPKQYRTIYTTARSEDSPQGNPMFDRTGELVAITIVNNKNAQVIAVSIHEIAEQLPSMTLARSTRYTGEMAPMR